MSFENAPFGLADSSLKVPCSATRPSDERTMRRSDRLMVDSRCAIEIVVLFPRNNAASAEFTSVSDSASRAEVAGMSIVGVDLGIRKEKRGRLGCYLHRE